jgi:hypothetical protein
MQGLGELSRLPQTAKKQEPKNDEGTIHPFFLEA